MEQKETTHLEIEEHQIEQEPEKNDEGIIEQGEKSFDNLDTEANTVVENEKRSKETQLDQNPVHGFVIEKERSKESQSDQNPGDGFNIVTDNTSQQSLDPVTVIPPPNECVDLDKKNVTMENLIHETEVKQNASPAVEESKDQCVGGIDEAERNLPHEESHQVLQEYVNMDGKTAEVKCLQNEEPRELNFSKMIDGVIVDSQNESLKEEDPASTEDSNIKSQDDVEEMSNVDPQSSEENKELTSLVDNSLVDTNKNYDCLTITRLSNEEISTDPQCGKVPIDSKESQTKEFNINAPIIKLSSEGTATEVTNEEVSKVAEDLEVNGKIPELIIENTPSTTIVAVKEVENSDVALLKKGDASACTHDSNQQATETLDIKTELDPTIIVTQLSQENVEEGNIEQGDKSGEYLNDITEESTPQPITNTEKCTEGDGMEESSDSKAELPALDCEDAEKDNVYVEKQVTPKIEDTSNDYDAVSKYKDQSINETDIKITQEAPTIKVNKEENLKQNEADAESSNQLVESEESTKEILREDEIMAKESLEEAKKETTNTQYGSQSKEMSSIITNATNEGRAIKDHDIDIVERCTESVPNEPEVENFKEMATRSNLEDITETKDDTKKVSVDLELDLDTTGTDQNEIIAINKKEAHYTNPDLPQATSPSTEEAVTEIKSKTIREAPEPHLADLVHEIERQTCIADDQESLIEYQKNKPMPSKLASDGIEVKEDMKLTGQEVILDTSFVDKDPEEEKPDYNRSIMEDEKTHNLVFDSHMADEIIIAERKTTDGKEYTENKEPLDVFARESDRTVDEAEIDNNIREIKDVQVQDKIEKPYEVNGVQDRDLPVSKTSITVDISKVDNNKSIQPNQNMQVEQDMSHEEEYKQYDSDPDAPVMVEVPKDMESVASNNKSHGILSGVRSKVKHSISKVKKVITGNSKVKHSI